jgi:hypothetical protein
VLVFAVHDDSLVDCSNVLNDEGLNGQEKKQRQGFPPTPPEKHRGQIVPIHLAKA